MIYSYHSFILPFTCLYDKKNLYELFDNDNPDNIWKCTDISVISNSQRVISLETIDENKDYYDAYKFFNEAGRNLVFSDSHVKNTRNYEIKEDCISGLKYVVGTEKGEYRLPITRISLKFYETGITVFVMECTNSEYRTLDDIKRINEYGRRLGLPFWPPKGKNCYKCATYLKISNDDDSRILAFDNFLKDLKKDRKEISLSYVSKIVRMLLDKNGSGYQFRGKAVSEENMIQMKTLLEEKMYVASFIIDKTFCKKLYESYKDNNGIFSNEDKENLTELLRVDLPGDCSIGHGEERNIYLKDHLYLTAFSEKSRKLMAVTDQAYIKIVPESDYEEGYFRSVYLPLILIPLVQRNSIEIFHQKIMELTEAARKKINISIIRRIMNVQQKYVMFRNQFMPGIVTAQKEGRFLYSKLQTELSVTEDNKVLESQVGKLFEVANINQSYAFSKWALSLSLISLTLSGFSYLVTAQNISALDFSNYNGGIILALTISIIFVVIMLVIFGIFNRRRRSL